jgi:hypothetical protein
VLIPQPQISANLIVCEAVVPGKNGLLSAINILNVLHVQPWVRSANFKVVTVVNGYPGDPYEHIFNIQLFGANDALAASSMPHKVVLANHLNPFGPRTFLITTDFTLDVKGLGDLGTYIIAAYLDQNLVGRSHITLQRVVPR